MEERILNYIKVLSIPLFTLVLIALTTINLVKTDINWLAFFLLYLPFFLISIWIFKRCLRWVLFEIHNTDSPIYEVRVIDISLVDSNIEDPYFRIFYDTRGKILSIYGLKFYEVKSPNIDSLEEFYELCNLDEQKLINLISYYKDEDKVK
jgi:hypothetical protein